MHFLQTTGIFLLVSLLRIEGKTILSGLNDVSIPGSAVAHIPCRSNFPNKCTPSPVSRDNVHISSESDSSQPLNPLGLPDKIRMELELEDRIVTLHLVDNKNVQTEIPVYVGDKYGTRRWSPGDNGQVFRAYVDKTVGASVTIQVKKTFGRAVKTIYGLVPLDGKVYTLEPMDFSLSSTRNGPSTKRVKIEGESYRLVEEARDMDFKCDVRSKGVKQSPAPARVAGAKSTREKHKYVVEFMIAADYAVYKKWYDLSPKSSPVDKDVDAQKNITFYYVSMAAGVDLRYSGIEDPDFTINTRLVGLYIAKDPSQSPFTFGDNVRLDFDGDVYTDMYKGLDAFQDWVADHIATNGKYFEQATLFTENLLYDGTMVNGRPNMKSGLSNIGSFCNIGNKFSSGLGDSVSINRDKGLFGSTVTATHEMAHGLGVGKHDGVANECKTSDQYIMAIAPGGLDEDTYDNPMQFSPCSIRQISDFLRTLQASDPENCLLKTSPAPTVTSSIRSLAISRTFPGEYFDADHQCLQTFGPNSFYCRGGSRDAKICSDLTCWNDERQQCETWTELRAYDGTPCGHGKWCMLGYCTADPAASTAFPDTCTYGDAKDKVGFANSVNLACSQLAGAEVWRCYIEHAAGECCQTCPKLQDASKGKGCEFGDHDPPYCKQNPEPKNCYDENYRTSCCDTCAKLKGATASCEYGDKAAWCKDIKPDRCTIDAAICCETCEKHKNPNAIPGCEFGDQQSFCTEYPLSDVCGTYPDICCKTCHNYKGKKNINYAIRLLKDLLGEQYDD